MHQCTCFPTPYNPLWLACTVDVYRRVCRTWMTSDMQTEWFNDVRTGCLVLADRCLTCKHSNCMVRFSCIEVFHMWQTLRYAYADCWEALWAKGFKVLESMCTDVQISRLQLFLYMPLMNLAMLHEKWIMLHTVKSIHNRHALAFTACVVVTCAKLLACKISHRFRRRNDKTIWRVLIHFTRIC